MTELIYRVNSEEMYSRLKRTAKHHNLDIKEENYLTKVTISGDDTAMAAFEKDYNDPTVNY